MARYEVRMRVRQKNGFQAEIILGQIVYVAFDPPFRVDDDGFAVRYNDVRRMRQSGNKESFNVHTVYVRSDW